MQKLGFLAVFTALWFALAGSSQAAGNSAKGKEVYLQICFACHGMDPSKDGPLGPAITGSSKVLVTARVMNGNERYDQSYPKGYKPKRDTRLMTPFPQLKPNIDDLVAYLNQK
ncbi:MAG: cytochrome c [Candidatus Lambdaproteobacteria bacterium]|nr:cytochrome c [Candidatus Lambdaproteobacteria bacterium]